MIDPTEILDKATDFADDSFESSEERQKTLTQRLKIDTTSPFMLAHIIRPIIALTLLAMQVLLLIAMFMGVEIPEHIVYEVGGLLFSAIGFYFNSRKAEKINAKKVQAAIEIQDSKERMNIRREKQELKDDRKQKRRERRNQ